MLQSINSTLTKIWKKMRKRAYRESFVSAHISNTIAAQIAAMREAEDWTQTDLAKKVGTGQSRISALEDPNNQNVEIATLKRIASAFDVGLTVRFVRFSELARWSSQLSTDDLAVAKFDDDQVGAADPFGGYIRIAVATGAEALEAISATSNPINELFPGGTYVLPAPAGNAVGIGSNLIGPVHVQ